LSALQPRNSNINKVKEIEKLTKNSNQFGEQMVSSVAEKWRYIWLLNLIGVGATNVRDCILLAIPRKAFALKITRLMTTRAVETTVWRRTHLLIQARKIGVGVINVRDCILRGMPPKENVQPGEHMTIQAAEIIAWCRMHLLPRPKRTGGGVLYARDCILLAIRPPEESVLGVEDTVVVGTIN
jgi:hypothetical protein